MKSKFFYPLILFFAFSFAIQAQRPIETVRFAGPWAVPPTLQTDTVGLNDTKFKLTDLLTRTPVALSKEAKLQHADKQGRFDAEFTTIPAKQNELRQYQFEIQADRFVNKAKLLVYGQARYSLWMEGKRIALLEEPKQNPDSVACMEADLKLAPGTYRIQLSSLLLEGDSCLPAVRVELKTSDSRDSLALSLLDRGSRQLTLNDMIEGPSLGAIKVSPTGLYCITSQSWRVDNKSYRRYELRDANGRVIRQDENLAQASWLPKEDKLYMSRAVGNNHEVLLIDPVSGAEEVLATLSDRPFGLALSPCLSRFYYYTENKGPEKDALYIQQLDPDDRQPGWRNRRSLWMHDRKSGIAYPLSFGYRTVSLLDIRQDGQELLLSLSARDWTQQPFGHTTLLRYAPLTGKADTLLSQFRHMQYAQYTPDGKQLLITASANAFDGIGKTLPKDQLANNYDNQFFLMNLSDLKVKALTRDFNPSVSPGSWDRKSGHYYFTANDGSRKALYRYILASNRIEKLAIPEDQVNRYDVASYASKLYASGQSASSGDRLYIVSNGRATLLYDLSASKYAGVELPKCHDWNYTSADGTVVEGWYYLPPNFDATKKYPMLVYYYGGTSPVNRTLEGSYSLPLYAAQGYVVYCLNPSGSTGYGQEYAARHINAWGKRTADEIIAAVKKFAAEHSYVNAKRIGCFGASYGGFMTQYLQTQTDLFAAAVSHAGISSISSYWAGGFWGMGYSTVASAGSYPWNNPSLYVEQSPLFNADKIHTPLLLVHGSVDTNVPTSESVNMYNALKVLGREVELLLFTEQDHFIIEEMRRRQWTESIMAWFARWLQEDDRWWYELYPKRNI